MLVNKIPSLETLKTELLYWLKVVFDVSDPDYPIREADLKGIAQVAGVLSIRGLSGFLIGWFRLSESTIVEGDEYSHRGLLNQTTGATDYIASATPADISTLATDDLRMPLIPEGAVPLGYKWDSDGTLLSEEGKLDLSKLHLTPPEGYVQDIEGNWYWPLDPIEFPPPSYAPYYGNQFLSLASSYPMVVTLDPSVFQTILEYHQKIKANGPVLRYLFEITEALVSDLISDLEVNIVDAFELVGEHVYYTKITFTRGTEGFDNNDGWGRFSAWAYFIQSKYPLINFTETGD